MQLACQIEIKGAFAINHLFFNVIRNRRPRQLFFAPAPQICADAMDRRSSGGDARYSAMTRAWLNM
jgi:hypothetical protein